MKIPMLLEWNAGSGTATVALGFQLGPSGRNDNIKER